MERIRIAMVGLRFGRTIVDEMLAEPSRRHVELVAICDKDPAVLEPVRQKTGLRACTDIAELLADPTIQAIGVFTGPVGRAALIRRVIQAGKHVLTTKPFERDPDAALQVLLEGKKLGRVIHMNSPGPELPDDLRHLRHWQQTRDLGPAIACRIDTWAYYRDKPDGTWYDDPDLCPVAPIFRLGIYLINDLVRLLGPAQKVQVFSSRMFPGRPTANNGQLAILFPSGAIANIFSSFCINDGQFYRNSMILNFERGTVYRNVGPMSPEAASHSSSMTLVTRDESKPRIRLWNPSQETAYFSNDSGTYQYEAFQKACLGLPLRDEVTPEEIVGGLRVIRAMAKAEKSGATELV